MNRRLQSGPRRNQLMRRLVAALAVAWAGIAIYFLAIGETGMSIGTALWAGFLLMLLIPGRRFQQLADRHRDIRGE